MRLALFPLRPRAATARLLTSNRVRHLRATLCGVRQCIAFTVLTLSISSAYALPFFSARGYGQRRQQQSEVRGGRSFCDHRLARDCSSGACESNRLGCHRAGNVICSAGPRRLWYRRNGSSDRDVLGCAHQQFRGPGKHDSRLLEPASERPGDGVRARSAGGVSGYTLAPRRLPIDRRAVIRGQHGPVSARQLLGALPFPGCSGHWDPGGLHWKQHPAGCAPGIARQSALPDRSRSIRPCRCSLGLGARVSCKLR